VWQDQDPEAGHSDEKDAKNDDKHTLWESKTRTHKFGQDKPMKKNPEDHSIGSYPTKCFLAKPNTSEWPIRFGVAWFGIV